MNIKRLPPSDTGDGVTRRSHAPHSVYATAFSAHICPLRALAALRTGRLGECDIESKTTEVEGIGKGKKGYRPSQELRGT